MNFVPLPTFIEVIFFFLLSYSIFIGLQYLFKTLYFLKSSYPAKGKIVGYKVQRWGSYPYVIKIPRVKYVDNVGNEHVRLSYFRYIFKYGKVGKGIRIRVHKNNPSLYIVSEIWRSFLFPMYLLFLGTVSFAALLISIVLVIHG